MVLWKIPSTFYSDNVKQKLKYIFFELFHSACKNTLISIILRFSGYSMYYSSLKANIFFTIFGKF